MTVIAKVSYSLGSGTATAMIFFPITYYAMRKQYKLRPLSELWRAFWGCVVMLSILTLLFGQSSPDSSPTSFAMFMFLPIFVSAMMLYWANREHLSKPLDQQDEETPAAEKPSTVPFATQDIAQPTIIVASKEMIAFRFLLLAWGIGLLTLALSGSSYLMAEWKQSKVSSMALVINVCIDKVMKTTRDCQVPLPEANGTCSNLVDRCNKNPFFDQLVTERDDWNDRAENLLYAAIWLLILPSLLFYGIRWGLTGRLRPLWLLSR